MKISFKILDSDAQISNKILESIRLYLQPAFIKTQQAVQRLLPNQIVQVLTAEPEYNALINDRLRLELGIPDPAPRIQQIFDAWSTNVTITSMPISIKSNRLYGGFKIDMIKSDFSDVLSLPAATVIDDTSGSVIPWLQWLLLDGTKILIRNYKVQIGPNPRSRTGQAIMVDSPKENWRIPPQFAGTINNNWVTRAIDRLDDNITKIIENELKKNI